MVRYRCRMCTQTNCSKRRALRRKWLSAEVERLFWPIVSIHDVLSYNIYLFLFFWPCIARHMDKMPSTMREKLKKTDLVIQGSHTLHFALCALFAAFVASSHWTICGASYCTFWVQITRTVPRTTSPSVRRRGTSGVSRRGVVHISVSVVRV